VDADALYALAPEDFTAARDEAVKAAKADGDPVAAKALQALRRPSLAAWLVNRLTVEQPDLLQQLLGLGPALAEAQAGGDAAALRTLGAQRRSLVEAVSDAAAQGRTVSTAVRAEVVATVEAALADPGSAEAVRSGRLVRALSYAGFGPVDLAGAVAEVPGPPPAKARAGTSRSQTQAAARAVVAAEHAAHEAAGRLDDAVQACGRAERRRTDATAATAVAAEAVAAARGALEAAEQDRTDAALAQQDAESASAAAVGAVQVAQDAAERARTALDELRRA